MAQSPKTILFGSPTSVMHQPDPIALQEWMEEVNTYPSTIAADFADVAAAAVSDAEAARDAAFVNADIYADIATGRAAVANGEQFAVVASDGEEIVRYRRDSSSTQTEVARYPAAAWAERLAVNQYQQAVWRARQHSEALTFSGFVNASTAAPSHVKHKAYISTETGTVLGLSVSEGDLIVDDGAAFAVANDRAKVVYPLEDPSYNKLNPDKIVPDHYLVGTTGVAVRNVNDNRYMTDFMYVKGVTFIASNLYAYGPMVAYDENKQYIAQVSNTSDGTLGKFTVPEGTVYIRASGTSASSVFMYLDDLTYLGTRYEYGMTLDSIRTQAVEDALDSRARIDYVDTLNIRGDVNVLDPDKFIEGYTINSSGNLIASGTLSASPFLYCRGKSFASTNMFFYGGIYAYDEDYGFISNIPRNADTGYFDIPANAYYIRGVFQTAINGQQYLYWDTALDEFYPFLVDRFNYKYKGKKLVTIGDSITYQKSWQPRLVELTGMVWDSDETRLGVGYVEIDPTTHEDLGNYVREDAAIVDSGSTFTDNYGATLTIYSKGAQRYRKAFRMAEGGETVMPRPEVTQSIYSRCGDAQYYEPDVIIIHAGANDRGYCVTLPTVKPNGRLSDITGITNLESEDPDLINDYEIYTTEAPYTDVGDYTAEGDTTGRKKYSGTFKAAYRGMVKKVIDGNPSAIVFLCQTPPTFLYPDTYQNKTAEYASKEMNRVIAEIGYEFGCQVIDLSTIFGNYNASQWFTADGQYIHPNSSFGGPKIADYIHSQIG